MRKRTTREPDRTFCRPRRQPETAPRRTSRAEEVHNFIDDILVNAGIAKRTRLQGSFARKTMLPPLHDVDKVIELVDDLVDQYAVRMAHSGLWT